MVGWKEGGYVVYNAEEREGARPGVANYWIRPRVVLVLQTANSCSFQKIFAKNTKKYLWEKVEISFHIFCQKYIQNFQCVLPTADSCRWKVSKKYLHTFGFYSANFLLCSFNRDWLSMISLPKYITSQKSSLVFISWLEMIRVGF